MQARRCSEVHFHPIFPNHTLALLLGDRANRKSRQRHPKRLRHPIFPGREAIGYALPDIALSSLARS